MMVGCVDILIKYYTNLKLIIFYVKTEHILIINTYIKQKLYSCL